MARQVRPLAHRPQTHEVLAQHRRDEDPVLLIDNLLSLAALRLDEK
jgi:hypothetical protein